MAIIALPYMLLGADDVLTGAIRGCGVSLAPVIINLVGTCGLRLLWISLLDTSVYGVEYVYFSYPMSWSVVLVCLTACYLWIRHKQKKERDTLC